MSSSRSRRLVVLGPVLSPHTVDIAAAMAERGYRVWLAGFRTGIEPPAEIEGTGIAFSPLELHGPAAFSFIARVRALRRLIREAMPDVIHAHVLSSDPFTAVAARARPLVATAWGSDVMLADGGARLRNRVVVRHADMLTADSASLCRRLVDLGAPSERVTLLNWGVDTQRFSPAREPRAQLRERLGLPPGRLILSSRTPSSPLYNVDTVVAAFETLAERDPDLHLLVKHDGPAASLVRDPEIAERIHLFGHIPMERLIDFYRAADVCVSIPSSDSSPRTVWEALACGCPTIVSALDWTEGMLTPGQDALTVEIDRVAVAAAIRQILDNDALAARLSANGRRLVEAKHDQTVEMDRLAELYTRLSCAYRSAA